MNRTLTAIYLGKLLLAAFLTYWLALVLEVPQPQTALVTVFIVMQPQSGPVLAKSAWRLLGTLVGLVMAVVLIALFGQHSEIFLAALAVWVGLCCGFAARYRNFQAYAFVLSGYTVAIVGVPALVHPQEVFMSAVWRALEIGLAILCSGAISAVVLPQSSTAAMRQVISRRFGQLAGFAADSFGGDLAAPVFAQRNRGFAADAVALDNLKDMAAFEDPAAQQRSARLSRLNSEFMNCHTRVNALHNVLARLRRHGRVYDRLQPAVGLMLALFNDYRDQSMNAEGAGMLAGRLQQLSGNLRVQLKVDDWTPTPAEQLDFDTVGFLLERLCDELQECALTHASLGFNRHPRERWSGAFIARTNRWLCLAAGLRGAATVAVAATFWVVTAWPSGISLMISAAAGVSLAASTPNPGRTGVQMGLGVVLSSLVGFIEYFYVYPVLDGYALLCMALAPALLFGALLTTRMATMGIGLGFLITLASGSFPNNLTIYNPSGFINDCIANIMAFGLAAVAGAIILPSNAPWAWRQLLRDLRGQVRYAVQAGPRQLREKFESRTRDVLHQASTLAASSPPMQQDLLRWALLVQDVGHAVIECRAANSQAHRQTLRAVADAMARPSQGRRDHAVAQLRDALQSSANRQESVCLHFMGNALRSLEFPAGTQREVSGART